jgi:hypothetical protein
MWHDPFEKSNIIIPNVNDELAKLVGELSDDEARITLAKFLYKNLGFTVELLTGMKLYPDQIINIKGILESNYSLCVWGRGMGKCELYHSDTQLVTKRFGLISLTKLFPNVDFSKHDEWVEIPETELWNGTKWVKINKILIQQKIPSTRITTSNGYSLAGSNKHLVKVWDKQKCEVVWKRYYELNTDDYICISRNKNSLDILNIPTSSQDVKEAYLIGLLLGDGCLRKNSFSIVSADEEILTFIETFKVGKRIKDKRSKAININLSNELKEYLLNKYNIKICLSHDKEIPQYILESKSLIKSCLQGLFDTDGCSYNNCLGIQYSSTSIHLIKQIHNLLSLFGIIGAIKEKKTKSIFGKAWVINIFGDNVIKFYNEIGFKLTRKTNNIKENLSNITNTNKDIVPGIKEYCQKYIKSNIRLPKILSDEWRNKIRRKNNQINISYNTLKKYKDFFVKAGLNQTEIQKIDNIIEENFFFDKVKSIEELGQQDCIDFNVPDGQHYWSNCFISHNTSIAALVAVLLCIFKPKTNILICGPTFRTSRFIFNYIEKIVESREGKMLAACLGTKSKRNDQFEWKINDGSIVAIPLNGEKIRGFRANVLIIDEFLLMQQDLVERVLMPYLIVPQDLKKRQKIRAIEDNLIKKGIITEEQRTKPVNNAKLIGLSSASFTCEYLYRTYQDYINQIYNPSQSEDAGKYFVSQMSWDSIKDISDRIDKTVIEQAQSNQANLASFKREYGATFVDGSDGYFSMNKMLACSIKDGEEPTQLLKGAKNKKYLLSIDPNLSGSETSDHFAMCVLELDETKEKKCTGTVVHQYAKAGKDLKDHIAYFFYIFTHFNIEIIIIDNAGYQFIESANESEAFRSSNINIKIFEFAAEKDGEEYVQQLREARKGYNKQIQRIAFTQVFTTDFITKSNEWLQGCIDFKRVWFSSPIKANQDSFDKAIQVKLNDNLIDDKLDTGESAIGYFIDNQDTLMKQLRYECSAIEVTVNSKGVQTFDLPQVIKRDQSASRMRRDSYTALLLAAWGMKAYNDLLNTSVEQYETFEPFVV